MVNSNEEILGRYKNGNYNVILFKDGTKVRYNELNNLTPSFAESIDLNITNKCDGGCAFCYQNAKPDNKDPELLNEAFLNQFHPYTELAINGNDLTHPELEDFLKKLKERNIICNLTVNVKHLNRNKDLVKKWIKQDLIHGLGVSLNYSGDYLSEAAGLIYDILEGTYQTENIVIHSIAGILNAPLISRMFDTIKTVGKSKYGVKFLILGYKNIGRGKEYDEKYDSTIKNNILYLKKNLKELVDTFEVVSFDNLALEQLDVKNTLNIQDYLWNSIYMGDEGNYTFYIDLATRTFAQSSLVQNRHPMENLTVDEMFKIVRKESTND